MSAAACLLPSFPGSTVPDWAKRFVAEGGRGFVLFSYNCDDLPSLVAALRAEREDLLLAIAFIDTWLLRGHRGRRRVVWRD